MNRLPRQQRRTGWSSAPADVHQLTAAGARLACRRTSPSSGYRLGSVWRATEQGGIRRVPLRPLQWAARGLDRDSSKGSGGTFRIRLRSGRNRTTVLRGPLWTTHSCIEGVQTISRRRRIATRSRARGSALRDAIRAGTRLFAPAWVRTGTQPSARGGEPRMAVGERIRCCGRGLDRARGKRAAAIPFARLALLHSTGPNSLFFRNGAATGGISMRIMS